MTNFFKKIIGITIAGTFGYSLFSLFFVDYGRGGGVIKIFLDSFMYSSFFDACKPLFAPGGLGGQAPSWCEPAGRDLLIFSILFSIFAVFVSLHYLVFTKQHDK